MNRREIPSIAIENEYILRDGWSLRNIAWPRKNIGKQIGKNSGKNSGKDFKGSVLFLPGRGDHYEKYLETLSQLDSAGMNVTAFDWRGQGGSGRMLDDPSIGHIEDFGTWISDLQQIYEDWKAKNPGPYFIISHSMGGHLVMRALAEKVIDPDGVILSAPMLGLSADPVPFFIRYGVVRLLIKFGFAEKHAWKVSEKPFSSASLRAKMLTNDIERYEDEMFWWKTRPNVKLGPASWRWVEQAMKSTRALEKPNMIEHIKTPILILAAENDQLVDTGRIREDAQRLPNCELIVFDGNAAHELLRENDEIRDKCMNYIYKFIDDHQ